MRPEELRAACEESDRVEKTLRHACPEAAEREHSFQHFGGEEDDPHSVPRMQVKMGTSGRRLEMFREPGRWSSRS